MGRTTLQQAIAQRQRALRRAVGDELRRVRVNEGLSARAVSAAAGLHPSHLPRIEAGDRQPTPDALVALAAAMGHDVSIRLFPTTGPRIRDHIQARMIEALLRDLHPRWTAHLEVAVYRPVRGVIDVVLQDTSTLDIVAGEGHSRLTTVERQLRWAGQKADSLPSANGWPWSDAREEPRVSRLLLLRSSSAMHELVRDVAQTFRSAYPADPAEAVAALRGPHVRWPGPSIVWAVVDGAGTHLVDGSPRGLHGRR